MSRIDAKMDTVRKGDARLVAFGRHEATRPGTHTTIVRVFEGLLLIYFVALFYKLNAIGILSLAGIAACGALFPARTNHLTSPVALLTFGYVFLATVTAFYYDPSAGTYRSIQFICLLAAGIAFSNYMSNYWSERSLAFLRSMSVVCILVLLHMIVYHMAIGRYVTWKYLFDTKTVLTILPVIIFGQEDAIRTKFGLGTWSAVLLALASCVFLSGERKAYLLLALLFFLSRTSPLAKAAVTLAVLSGLAFYVAQASPDDYLRRQVTSVFTEDRELHISEFYLIDSIGDQSDIIRDFVGRMASAQFAEHRWLGLGAGGYAFWSENEFGSFEESGGLSMNVHGEVNRIPVESGYLGIALALALLAGIGRAIARDISMKGGWASNSSDRLAGYFLIALLTYTWYEALDTFMLSMIIVCGLEVARIDMDNFERRRAQRYSRSSATLTR